MGPFVQARTAQAGCDGIAVAACSASTNHYAWTAFETINTCPVGAECQLLDPLLQPTCSDAPAPDCTTDSQCAGGPECGKNQCVGGVCDSSPAASGTPCGNGQTAVTYSCSSAAPGGDVLVQQQLWVCNGQSTACNGGVWTDPVVATNCPPDTTCQVLSSTQPGSCVGAGPDCTPGSACCSAAGDPLPSGSQCGNTAVSTEYACSAPVKGGDFLARESYPACDGGGFCNTSTFGALVVGDWVVVGGCSGTEVCTESFSSTSPPTCAGECNFGACCDNGSYSPPGTTCSASPNGTKKYDCTVLPGGLHAVTQQVSYNGCPGDSGSCSFNQADYVWVEPTVYETCAANEICDPWSFDSVPGTCDAVTDCVPNAECCDSQGSWLPSKTQCGEEVLETKYECEAEVKGGTILAQFKVPGCDPWHECVTTKFSSYVHIKEWEPVDQCAANLTCDEGASATQYPDCDSDCTTGVCCSDADEYEPLGTVCGFSALSTGKYSCAVLPNGKHAVMVSSAWYGCPGDGSVCSYSSSDHVFVEPVVHEECQTGETCDESFSESFAGDCVP
ncbi:MAG: hypothetical protein ACI9WU_000082 [Myxococcota bacterium]|jgi:hypothetical protein